MQPATFFAGAASAASLSQSMLSSSAHSDTAADKAEVAVRPAPHTERVRPSALFGIEADKPLILPLPALEVEIHLSREPPPTWVVSDTGDDKVPALISLAPVAGQAPAWVFDDTGAW